MSVRPRRGLRMLPPKPAEVNLSGSPHAHRCVRCGLRYEDSCDDSPTDGECTPCRGERPRPPWYRGRDPVACCLERSRLATRDDIRLYRLAGQAEWWICQACKRTHPYNPKEK